MSHAKWEREQRESRVRRALAGKVSLNKTLTVKGKPLATSPKALEKPAEIKNPTPADIILAMLRQDSDGKYTNAFEVMTSSTVLRMAYEVIKSKPGNMVRGATKETLDGISKE